VKTAKELWQLWWEWRVGSPAVIYADFKQWDGPTRFEV